MADIKRGVQGLWFCLHHLPLQRGHLSTSLLHFLQKQKCHRLTLPMIAAAEQSSLLVVRKVHGMKGRGKVGILFSALVRKLSLAFKRNCQFCFQRMVPLGAWAVSETWLCLMRMGRGEQAPRRQESAPAALLCFKIRHVIHKNPSFFPFLKLTVFQDTLKWQDLFFELIWLEYIYREKTAHKTQVILYFQLVVSTSLNNKHQSMLLRTLKCK